MNAYTLLHAMSGVRAEFVLEARDFLGYGAEKAETGRAGRRLWPALLAAAILALLLAACGYAVYIASMSYREPQPEDEKQYYYDGAEGSPNEGLHMDLNHGDCALAVHFDTEEPGYYYAFRLDPSLADREDWVPLHLPLSETLKTFSDKRYYPADQVRSYEQALREAGLTREEAETWDYQLSIHEKEGERRLILMIEIADAPELHGGDPAGRESGGLSAAGIPRRCGVEGRQPQLYQAPAAVPPGGAIPPAAARGGRRVLL